MYDDLGAPRAPMTVNAADVRVLHRVDLPTGPTPDGQDLVAGIGVVIDVKPASSCPASIQPAELVARRFSYDANHVITRIDRCYVWRHEPDCRPCLKAADPAGASRADLAEGHVDAETFSRILNSASIRISHDAPRDRPFVEQRFPGLAETRWACVTNDVDWASHGLERGGLGWLLAQCGFFHDPYQADANVNATIQILRHELAPDRTALAVLMANASQESWRVRAFGAAFERKDDLRERGYRWDARQRVWWREVRDQDQEQAWLAEHIYGAHGRGTPDFEPVDWTSRYA